MAIKLKKDEIELIKSIILNHLQDIEVYAFGSRVKDKPHRYSDLDLMIKGDEPIPLSILTKLSDDFSESDLPFKIELVDWNRISSEFQKEILTKNQKIL